MSGISGQNQLHIDRYQRVLTDANVTAKSVNTFQSSICEFPVYTPNVKLPHLHMKNFRGDPLQWTLFWDNFSASIETSAHLRDVIK